VYHSLWETALQFWMLNTTRINQDTKLISNLSYCLVKFSKFLASGKRTWWNAHYINCYSLCSWPVDTKFQRPLEKWLLLLRSFVIFSVIKVPEHEYFSYQASDVMRLCMWNRQDDVMFASSGDISLRPWQIFLRKISIKFSRSRINIASLAAGVGGGGGGRGVGVVDGVG